MLALYQFGSAFRKLLQDNFSLSALFFAFRALRRALLRRAIFVLCASLGASGLKEAPPLPHSLPRKMLSRCCSSLCLPLSWMLLVVLSFLLAFLLNNDVDALRCLRCFPSANWGMAACRKRCLSDSLISPLAILGWGCGYVWCRDDLVVCREHSNEHVSGTRLELPKSGMTHSWPTIWPTTPPPP